ncbi:MAG: anhydro-N-acetylmuramic acid kinase, partial [Clostridia bacterium]|nr:anhydro-N-acetylmuramic acid kinase [Clostridia bacterium]
MKTLKDLMKKDTLRVIGLMSGTSADGMDAALTEITGFGLSTKVKTLAFVSLPYSEDVRGEILRLASGGSGGSRDLCLFHFFLGEISLDACRAVCGQAGIDPETVDLVGSHGQTLYHVPSAETYLGRPVRGTLQLGEASVIAEGLGCPVVSDFRVRDLAAGGQGAPLVPYTEYLLYRREDETVGLQNIGGIGNITVLPRGGRMEDTFAFDTGPGNMVMDQ